MLKILSGRAGAAALACLLAVSPASAQTAQPAPHMQHAQPATGQPATGQPAKDKPWDSITDSACPKGVEKPSVHCSSTVAPAFGTDGTLWLAWVNDGRVFVSSSTDKGKTLSAPAPINAAPQAVDYNGENRPKVLAAPDGTIYVTYTIKAQKKFTGDVLFSRSLDGGKTFSEPRSVNDAKGDTSLRFENLAVNDKGELFITWLDKRDLFAAKAAGQPYTGSGIYYTYSTDRGETFAPNIKIADSTCECCRIGMTVNAKGLPEMVWRHIYDNGSRDHALSAFKDVSTPGDLVRISSDEWPVEACPHHGPSLTLDVGGVRHVTWYTQGTARQGGFYARSTDGGKTFVDIIPIGDNDSQAEHPFALALGNSVYAAWKEFDGEDSVLMVMSSADQGKTWGKPEAVLKCADASDHPLLVHDGKTVYASWWGADEGWRMTKVGGRL